MQHPDLQAETINELRPQRKQFIVKRSQRCRSCEHNVSKPDFCPASIKFKIQLAALYVEQFSEFICLTALNLYESLQILFTATIFRKFELLHVNLCALENLVNYS